MHSEFRNLALSDTGIKIKNRNNVEQNLHGKISILARNNIKANNIFFVLPP